MLGHYFDKMNKPFEDRYSTSLVRIKQIIEATKGEEEVDSYFQQAGLSLMRLADIWEMISSGHVKTFTFDALKELNRSLYKEVSEHYETSFANPEKCTQVFGEDLGQKLCYIYTRMIDGISYVFEGQKFRLALNNELFIKSYEAITQGNGAVISELIHKESMDALDLKTEVAILRKFDAGFNSYSDVLLSSDLNDLRYLFSYGLYVGENEIKTAQYLMTLPEENIQRLANVCTEAFQKGYLNGNKEIPLSEKKTINIAYPISFERIIRKVVENFRDMGLEPLVYSDVFTAARPRLISTPPNPQFSYDHRFDEALFFSQDYVDASEAAFAALMEKHKDLAREMAGVALQESFGNKPFSPLSKGSCIAYNEEQTSLKNEQTATRNKTSNAYLPGSAWSFVIIAYPLPSIGEDYEDIFKDVIAVNSLDSQVYEKIQKQIIDVLDLGEFVHVVGKGENTTDILVKLHELTDSENQTNFENCTADLNVPVGEVYTSPVLLGTTGKIHVSQVYLNNLKYENLQISFKDGFIEGYTCTNFDTDEENEKFVHEN